MRIKEDSIRQLTNTINIVDVISDYVTLKKKGRNYLGLCPFHTEKTPSFTVSAEKEMYYCFGCGEGGSAISFLMKKENFGYKDAVEELAKRFGFQLEYEDFTRPSEEDSELERLYEYSQRTAQYYHECLINTNEGEKVLKYLSDRGIEEKSIIGFGLGFSLSGWGHLNTFIEKNKLIPEVFEQLGLLIRREDGSFFERFRDRLMFPIFSSTGKVIAFGGRLLINDSQQAKYLNSPETRIFIKGKTLFGLSKSKDFIRKEGSAVIVEGYMDLISLYQNGIRNVVASCGTALTIDQLQIISRVSKNIFIMYDSDEAGKKAAQRGAELCLETGFDFKIVSLDNGEDPDSYVQKNGSEALIKKIKTSGSYIDFIYNFMYESRPDKNNDIRLAAVQKLIELTAKVKDPIRKALFIKELSDKTKIFESAIMQSVNKTSVVLEKTEIKTTEKKEPGEASVKKNSGRPAAEKELVRLFFEKEDYGDLIFMNVQLEEFSDPEINQIMNLVYKIKDGGLTISPQILIDQIKDEKLQRVLSEIIFETHRISDNWDQTSNFDLPKDVKLNVIVDCIRKVKTEFLVKKKSEVMQMQKKILDLEKMRKLYDEELRLSKEIEDQKIHAENLLNHLKELYDEKG